MFGSVALASSEKANSDDILVGAEQFSLYREQLRGKKLGVVVNQTSLVGKQHLVDFLTEQGVNITRVFSPEHGFRGTLGAGELVADELDPRTEIKLVSLYGKNKKPMPKDISQIDLFLFDIQDVGVRFYTYISTLHYIMESCAENDIPLIVLDRPNPNGDYIDGPVLNPEFKSFVGLHPIPVVHGLTVGELAKMINGEGWLDSKKKCQLTVVSTKNYDHSKFYSLPIKPSPNLPNDLSIRLYPSLAFFEATKVSVGRGTDWPFQVLGYPEKQMGIFKFDAKPISGSWSELNYAGKTLYGELFTTDPMKGISLEFLISWKAKFDQQEKVFINRPKFFDKLSGNDSLRNQLLVGVEQTQIKKSWSQALLEYNLLRKKYLLYDDHPQVLRFLVYD